jgi:hypothetical protein
MRVDFGAFGRGRMSGLGIPGEIKPVAFEIRSRMWGGVRGGGRGGAVEGMMNELGVKGLFELGKVSQGDANPLKNSWTRDSLLG